MHARISHALAPVLLALALPATAVDAAEPTRVAGPGRDSATLWKPQLGTAPYAMSSFRVQSTSQRSFGKLGALLGLGHLNGWFAGAFDLDVSYERLANNTTVRWARRASCATQCTFQIAKPKGDQVFVLSGFMFETLDGSTHPVRSLAVRPNPSAGKIEVELQANQPVDFEVIVQYAYVDASAVVGGRVHSATKVNREPHRRLRFQIPGVHGDHGRTMLHGFDVHFLDGAHPLTKLTVTASSTGGMIWFLDDSKTHDYEGTMQVVRLND